MLYLLYRWMTGILRPFYLYFILPKRIKIGKEDIQRYREKLGVASRSRPHGKLLWIHAASVGESLSVVALVENIMAAYPDLNILMTAGTLTAAGIIPKKFPHQVIHQFAPLDFQPFVDQFLSHWQPNCVFWVESDFWPNTLFTLKQRRIPLISINMRLSSPSMKLWQRIPSTFQKMMACFSVIFPQTAHLEKFLQSLNVKNVHYMGNLKYVSASNQALSRLPTNLKGLALRSRPTWIAASTHAGEEKIVLQAHQKLKAIYPDILTILAPRHPNRVNEVANLIQKNNLSVAQWSKIDCIDVTSDILIIDQIGLLMDLYHCCEIVLMGGSFVPIGGHNIIEPALKKCAILHGPFMDNFQEIVSQFNHVGALYPVSSVENLVDAVNDLLSHPLKCQELQEKAWQVAFAQRTILSRLMDALHPFLKSNGHA